MGTSHLAAIRHYCLVMPSVNSHSLSIQCLYCVACHSQYQAMSIVLLYAGRRIVLMATMTRICSATHESTDQSFRSCRW